MEEAKRGKVIKRTTIVDSLSWGNLRDLTNQMLSIILSRNKGDGIFTHIVIG